MLRGILGSVKSENPQGKGKLGNGKLKKKIINYDKLINKLIRLGVIIINLSF